MARWVLLSWIDHSKVGLRARRGEGNMPLVTRVPLTGCAAMFEGYIGRRHNGQLWFAG